MTQGAPAEASPFENSLNTIFNATNPILSSSYATLHQGDLDALNESARNELEHPRGHLDEADRAEFLVRRVSAAVTEITNELNGKRTAGSVNYKALRNQNPERAEAARKEFEALKETLETQRELLLQMAGIEEPE